MRMDLDTEDRLDRAKRAFDCLIDLLQISQLKSSVDPHDIATLLDVVHDEYKRVLVPNARPRPPCNDQDE